MTATMPESCVVQMLRDNAPIAALVNSRISPHIDAQGEAMPRIAYSRVSGEHEQSHRGSSGLCRCVLQLSFFAATYAVAKQLGELARKVLQGYHGTVGTVTVGAILILTDIDGFEPSPGLDQQRVYSVIQEYAVWFNEDVPVLSAP